MTNQIQEFWYSCDYDRNSIDDNNDDNDDETDNNDNDKDVIIAKIIMLTTIDRQMITMTPIITEII